jgi:hypothetical protein
MPNLLHAADLVAGKLHHIDVIRARIFASRLTRTTVHGSLTASREILRPFWTFFE